MGYVGKEYYDNVFGAEPIEEKEFERLAEIASDLIDAIILQPITDETDKEQLAKAAAYQVEYIMAQGGVSAVTGNAESQKAVTEKLDDYSISEAQTDAASQNQATFNGIPISPLTLSILRKLGLMSRWMYAGRKRCSDGL